MPSLLRHCLSVDSPRLLRFVCSPVQSAVTTPFTPLPITMTAAILDGKTGDALDAAAAAMRASPVNLLMITSFVLRQLASWPADASGSIRFNGPLKALASACVRAVGNMVTGDGVLTSLTYSSGAVVSRSCRVHHHYEAPM